MKKLSQRAKVSAVVCIGVFVASLDLFIVNIAFPDLRADFPDTSLGGLSWVLNAYAIVFAALLVPAGRWADRAGRKRAFLTGMAVFTAASAACALAPSVEFLVGARVVQAAGAALLLPTSLALLLPEFPVHRRQVAVGIWAAVGGSAAAAGPPIGGVLTELSWHWVFLVNLPIGVAAIVAGARVLTEAREPAGHAPDTLGAATLAAGVAALALAIVKGPDWGWGSAAVTGLFAASAVLLAAVAARSRRHPAPVVEPALLRVRRFALANAAIVVFYAGFGAFLLGTVLFLTTVWGKSVLDAGLMLAPGPAMAASTAVPGSLLGQRFGQAPVGAIGGLLFAAGATWWLTHMSAQPDYLVDMLPSAVIGGIGVGLVIPSTQGAGTATLPPARFATGTAVLNMSRQIGTVLGVAIFVAILGTPAPTGPEALGAFENGWGFIVGVSAASALVMLAMGRAEPAPSAARAEALGANSRGQVAGLQQEA